MSTCRNCGEHIYPGDSHMGRYRWECGKKTMTKPNDHTCDNSQNCPACQQYIQAGGILRIIREHLCKLSPQNRAVILKGINNDFCHICGAVKAACHDHGRDDIIAIAANDEKNEMAQKWLEAQPLFEAIAKYQAAFKARGAAFDKWMERAQHHPKDETTEKLHQEFLKAYDKWKETDYEIGVFLVPGGNIWPKES